jgi:DNA-binding winged helix-turn-helix (wHTH) protein
MEEFRPSPRKIRFEAFEVDLQAGQLCQNGLKIKLQEQPFQVLRMLLEPPGQAVTREELRERLWSADTFVDFDHGLNKAINKIREALGDSADNPRFIETLPRRGYRFIASVESSESTGRCEGMMRSDVTGVTPGHKPTVLLRAAATFLKSALAPAVAAFRLPSLRWAIAMAAVGSIAIESWCSGLK